MQRMKVLWVALLWVICSPVWALTVIHNKADEPKEQLLLSILKLALSKTAPDAQFKPVPQFLEQGRMVADLQTGQLSVMWAGTKQEYETDLLPIRIPLLKGMLGYRLFIIRKEDQPIFDKINTLDDLKKLKAGQGRFWGDTAVLKAAGLNVVTPTKYPNLFPMLEGGRFDYFPRAVHEPWVEVEKHPELNLTVEKHILLVYPFAMYFFVAKNNPELAKLITDGLEKAIADGSFNQLFFNNPLIKSSLEKADLKHRTIIRIPNPYMSPETPTNRPELWLDPSKL